MKRSILFVDDDSIVRAMVADFLDAKGYTVYSAGDSASAQIAFRSKRPDIAIVDYILPDGDALELIERFRAVDPRCPIIVLTGHGSIDLAVRTIQEGASHFLTKPVDLSALLTVVGRLLDVEMLRRQQEARRSSPEAPVRMDPFVGESAAIRALKGQVWKILDSDAPVLLNGETGSGKGVVARWIHDTGTRQASPFVDINCAGLSREFLDSELFGHERGAFTGAVAMKQGLFEIAHGGTLFLDEIGDVDLQLQPKLLKAVEEKRFRRIGDVQDRAVDVRLIGATNRDLASMAASGEFRSDLYFRISTIPIRIPPLRERAEDLPDLIDVILADIGRRTGRHGTSLAPEATRALVAYSWPGNLRELRNVLERATLVCDGSVISSDDLHLQFAPQSLLRSNGEIHLTLEEMERQHIDRVLDDVGRNVDRAALRLGIPRSSLYQKIRRFGLSRSKV